MNSERYPPPRPLSHSTRQPQPHDQQQQQQPQPQNRLLPRGNYGKQAAATAEQQGNCPSQQAKAKRAERRGGGGSQQKADWQAKERMLRSHSWTSGAQLLGVEEDQRLRMQGRLEQPNLAADEQVSQTRSPRLPAPKQHHQHTQAAAAAAVVKVARGRKANLGKGI
jgi:hypothetical protein